MIVQGKIDTVERLVLGESLGLFYVLGVAAAACDGESVCGSWTLKRCWCAACFMPHALPLSILITHRCANLHCLTGAAIESEEGSLAAVLEAQVLHGLGEHCVFTIILKMISAGRCVGLALVALAFSFAGAFVNYGRLWSGLKQSVHVTSHLRELMHCFV